MSNFILSRNDAAKDADMVQQSAVETALSDLDAVINGLAAAEDNLVSKLEPVLNEGIVASGIGAGVPVRSVEPTTSPLVGRIRGIAARIANITSHIQGAHQQLEI